MTVLHIVSSVSRNAGGPARGWWRRFARLGLMHPNEEK